MYESLGQNIAKRLEAKGSPAAGGDTPMHQDTVKRLTSVKDYGDLLDAVAGLEALVAAYIGLELTRYDWTKPIAGQTDRSKTIADYARIIFDAYRMVTSGAAKSIAAPAGDLATVVGRIRIVTEAPGMDTRPVQEFMAAVRDYIVLSLWIAARSEPGQKLVAGLAQNNATLALRIIYKGGSTSLLAFPAGPGAYCKAAGPAPDSADTTTRLSAVTAGGGAGSEMGAPVWTDTEPTAPELLAATFKRQTVDEALSKILVGSLSFTRDRSPFFTPARLELLHEIVHVLHNAQGINREKVPGLTKEEHDAWHNPEEYWTTAGAGVNENDFNATIGLPDRYGHGGLPLASLIPTSEDAQASLRRHAGF
jgi:hypothetical protein